VLKIVKVTIKSNIDAINYGSGEGDRRDIFSGRGEPSIKVYANGNYYTDIDLNLKKLLRNPLS
jgi:hypothetical protein